MNTVIIEKAPARTNRKGFESNFNFTFDGKSKDFDVFDDSESREKLQCQKCNPPLGKPTSKLKLCAACEAENGQTAQKFFENFKLHRKVIKCDRRCFKCFQQKTAAQMAKNSIVCRSCDSEFKDKGLTARNHFIETVKANIGRFLKEATV